MRGPAGNIIYDIILSRIEREGAIYPSFVSGLEYVTYPHEMYKDLSELRSKASNLAWADLLLRDVVELISKRNNMRSRLVKIASICLHWAEQVD